VSELGDRLIKSAEQALAFAKGEADPKEYRVHIPDEIDVKRIRKKLKMSQRRFAETYGFNVRTLQDWEQGRAVPAGATRTFLVILDREPEAVRRALTGSVPT
jgi:putative transcriptional regulator